VPSDHAAAVAATVALTNELGDICGDVHLGCSLDSCSLSLHIPGASLRTSSSLHAPIQHVCTQQLVGDHNQIKIKEVQHLDTSQNTAKLDMLRGTCTHHSCRATVHTTCERWSGQAAEHYTNINRQQHNAVGSSTCTLSRWGGFRTYVPTGSWVVAL
jgi:hypothetical protein